MSEHHAPRSADVAGHLPPYPHGPQPEPSPFVWPTPRGAVLGAGSLAAVVVGAWTFMRGDLDSVLVWAVVVGCGLLGVVLGLLASGDTQRKRNRRRVARGFPALWRGELQAPWWTHALVVCVTLIQLALVALSGPFGSERESVLFVCLWLVIGGGQVVSAVQKWRRQRAEQGVPSRTV